MTISKTGWISYLKSKFFGLTLGQLLKHNNRIIFENEMELDMVHSRKFTMGILTHPMPPEKIQHWSDCSVYNGPALPIGPCDCGKFTLRSQIKNKLYGIFHKFCMIARLMKLRSVAKLFRYAEGYPKY